MGSDKISSQGLKLQGSGNWKSKHQVRGSIEEVGEDPAAPGLGRRKHETRLFLTINPNKGGYSAADDAVVYQAMTRVVQNLAKDETLRKVITWGPVTLRNGLAYRQDTYEQHVESVSVSATVERGYVQRRPHAHLFVSFTHFSQIQISKTLLQRWCREEYNKTMSEKYKLKGSQSMYVHIKLLPQSDWSEVIQMYLKKGMLAQ